MSGTGTVSETDHGSLDGTDRLFASPRDAKVIAIRYVGSNHLNGTDPAALLTLGAD